MTRLPTLRTKYGEGIGVELFLSFPEVQEDQRTFLDADQASGSGTLTANGVNFAVGQWVVIGQPGSLKTEIIQIHQSSAPSTTTITLNTSTQFAHSRGDLVRFIPYNQAIVETSTNGGTSFTPQSAVSIRADSPETYVQYPSDLSTYVYRFRFSNSYSGLLSSYSDTSLGSGYADNTFGSVKRRALRSMGESIGDTITDSDLDDWIQEARRAVDQDPRIFRWTFRTTFNGIIGQCLSGAYTVASPTTLRDRNTFKNILGIRLGKQFRPCVYQDRVRFNQNYLNVAHTTLNGAVVFGATSIVLTSSHDFDDSGSITIAGNAPGTLKSNIAYTANNRTTNTLTGVTGVPAAGYATGLDCWQNGIFGLPTAYTIDSGTIYFDTPFYDQLDGRNITGDWYNALPTAVNDSATFDEPFYDLYISFLKWKIKYKKANGKIDQAKDSDYAEFTNGVTRVVAQETNGQRINFIPDVEGFLSAGGYS